MAAAQDGADHGLLFALQQPTHWLISLAGQRCCRMQVTRLSRRRYSSRLTVRALVPWLPFLTLFLPPLFAVVFLFLHPLGCIQPLQYLPHL